MEKLINDWAGQYCSIIIPVFNQLPYTLQCLSAIERNTPRGMYEVIVVDNGSTDETRTTLQKLLPQYSWLKFVPLESNRGYAAANNIAADQAEGSMLVFLNNDTIPGPGWLSALCEQLCADSTVGILGSKLVFPHNNSINHAGYVFSKVLRSFYGIYMHLPAYHVAVNQQREYRALLGACLLIPRELFWEVGGFADYGLEDIDLCLKVRGQGLRIVYCPKSVVAHYGSVTIKESDPSTIPKMTDAVFRERWRQESGLADDELYYREDGFAVEYTADRKIMLRHKSDPAIGLVSEAAFHLDEGCASYARDLLLRAIEANPQYKCSYQMLSYSEAQAGHFEEALYYVDQLLALDSQHYEAYALGTQLALRLGYPQRAHQFVEQLVKFPDVPFGVYNEIQAITGKEEGAFA